MKNKRKRLLTMALATLMSMSLIACGKSSSNTEKVTKKASNATQAETQKSTMAETTAKNTASAIEVPTNAKPLSDIISEITISQVKSATLKEIGTMDTEIKNYDNFLYRSIGRDLAQCVDYMGNTLFDGNVNYIIRIVNNNIYDDTSIIKPPADLDLYVYYLESEGDFTYCGLMDAEGNIVISSNEKAGAFEVVNERFVKVYFPEAVSTNTKDTIYKPLIRTFSLQSYNTVTDYSGTIKLYDLKEHKFLENTAQKTKTNYSAGNDIITFSDENNKTVVVTSDDKIIKLEPGEYISGDFIIQSKNGVTYLYDKDWNKLFSTNYGVMQISKTNDYYAISDNDGKTGLMHKSGTVIIEPKFDGISYITEGMFMYREGQKYGLVSIDGTVLTNADYNEIAYTGIPGLFCGNENFKYDLIDEKGNIIINDAQYPFKEYKYFYHEGDSYKYLVINKPNEPLVLKSMGLYLGNHLLLDKDNMIIYDLVTGEKLLDGFEKAYYAYGYIYTVTGNQITIYQAEIPTE